VKVSIHKIHLFALLLVFCMMAGCGENQSTENIDKGMQSVEELQFEDAMTHFQAAKEAGENERLVYRGMGLASMGMIEYEEALVYFQAALDQGDVIPEDIDYDINYYMAVCYYKTNRLDEALERYNAILELRPKDTDAYFQRGLVELEKDSLTAAKLDFDKAISLDSKNYGLYIDVYSAMSDKGYEEQGKEYLNIAMEKGEKNMSSYDKGRLFFYMGDYTNARNFLEQARSDGNRSEEVILLLGQSYEHLSDSNYALTLYSDYVAQAPSGAIYNQMGLCYAGMKDYINAVTAFEAGMEVQDNACRQQLFFNRIVANEKLARFGEAKKLMGDYLKEYPDDEAALREYEFLKTR